MKKVEQLDPKTLTPHPKNSRLHSDRQVAQIAASISKFGFNVPVLVDGDGQILAGHGRTMAALEIGLDVIPCIRLDHLSDTEARAFIIADNKASDLGEWDTGMLDAEMSELEFDFDADDMEGLFDFGMKTQMRDVAIADLKPHPRNYKEHPQDQIEHLKQSIKDNGFYRSPIVANDNTIIAGHGLTIAATELGHERITVLHLDLDPNDPAAIKLMITDNEIGAFGLTDDIRLSELLRDLVGDVGLVGTGYDELMLSGLLLTTRNVDEVGDDADAAEWMGMPEFEKMKQPRKVIINFETEDNREAFFKLIGSEPKGSCYYPPQTDRQDMKVLKWDGQKMVEIDPEETPPTDPPECAVCEGSGEPCSCNDGVASEPKTSFVEVAE